MIDLGLSKMALIGAVALIVIGPEKLPRVARTVGTLLGKAQRYVNEVKAEVNRSMELDELKKMKETVESAARDVESSVQSATTDFTSTTPILGRQPPLSMRERSSRSSTMRCMRVALSRIVVTNRRRCSTGMLSSSSVSA